jgi:hypothetical protein
MSFLRNIKEGLRSLLRKERLEAEFDEELRGFLEMAAEEKMKQGMSRREALRAVRLERGSINATQEEVRSARWSSLMETLYQDVRFGLRMVRRNPMVTSTVTLTLALGIGVTQQCSVS